MKAVKLIVLVVVCGACYGAQLKVVLASGTLSKGILVGYDGPVRVSFTANSDALVGIVNASSLIEAWVKLYHNQGVCTRGRRGVIEGSSCDSTYFLIRRLGEFSRALEAIVQVDT